MVASSSLGAWPVCQTRLQPPSSAHGVSTSPAGVHKLCLPACLPAADAAHMCRPAGRRFDATAPSDTARSRQWWSAARTPCAHQACCFQSRLLRSPHLLRECCGRGLLPSVRLCVLHALVFKQQVKVLALAAGRHYGPVNSTGVAWHGCRRATVECKSVNWDGVLWCCCASRVHACRVP